MLQQDDDFVDSGTCTQNTKLHVERGIRSDVYVVPKLKSGKRIEDWTAFRFPLIITRQK